MEDSNNEFHLNLSYQQLNDNKSSEELQQQQQQQQLLTQEEFLYTQVLSNNPLFNSTTDFLDQQLFDTTTTTTTTTTTAQFNEQLYNNPQLPGTTFKIDTFPFNFSQLQSSTLDTMSFPMTQPPLACHAQDQEQRQEVDLFQELISLATENTAEFSEQQTWQQYPSQNKIANNRIYELTIVQQPSRARMCGFGDKDRRPISPAPILRLTVKTSNGQIIDPNTLDVSFLIVACDSIPMDTQKEEPTKNTFSTHQIINFSTTEFDKEGQSRNTSLRMRNLVGSLVYPASKLYDLDGNLGIFFICPDISIRSEGTYKLKFSLIDIGSPCSYKLNTTTVSKVLEIVETEPLSVYTPKNFPGVVKTTPLSICFSRQGIKIPNRQTKTKKSTAGDDDE